MHHSSCGIPICIIHYCDPLEGSSISTYRWPWASCTLLAVRPSTCSRWISVSCVNRISHHLHPKLFFEVLSMKHAPCHFHDSVIHILRHSILLKCIQGGRMLLDVMILWKMVECLGNKFFTIVWSKHLDFVLWLRLKKCIRFLNLSKHCPLNFNAYNHTFFEKLSI